MHDICSNYSETSESMKAHLANTQDMLTLKAKTSIALKDVTSSLNPPLQQKPRKFKRKAPRRQCHNAIRLPSIPTTAHKVAHMRCMTGKFQSHNFHPDASQRRCWHVIRQKVTPDNENLSLHCSFPCVSISVQHQATP